MGEKYKYLPITKSVVEEFLSPRQVEIALGVANGLSNREIADSLGIDEDTVKTLLYRNNAEYTNPDDLPDDRKKPRGVFGGVAQMLDLQGVPDSRTELAYLLITNNIVVLEEE